MRVLRKTRKNRFSADLNNLAYLMALPGRFLMPEIESRNLHDIWSGMTFTFLKNILPEQISFKDKFNTHPSSGRESNIFERTKL